MRVPAVWVEAAAPGAAVELDEREARHVARVLRRRRGDPVRVVSAAAAYEAVIEDVRKEGRRWRVRVRVGARIESEREAARRGAAALWRVAVAPAKTQDFEVAVRLASELGLEALVPLETARAQIPARATGRLERWRRIAREAAKQCGRTRPLGVEEPSSLEGLLAAGGSGPVWIALPDGPWHPELLDPLRPALFLVGPEGGFTPEEVEAAVAAGARPLGFPTPVLRTPTAVLFVAALAAVLASKAGVEPGPLDR